MPVLNIVAFASAGAGSVAFLATAVLALVRLRTRPGPSRAGKPALTLIRPRAGAEGGLREALASGLALDYPDIRHIFCAEPDDPAIPVIREIIAAYAARSVELLIGVDRPGRSPKINNIAKGVAAAGTDLLVFADSNAILPRAACRRCSPNRMMAPASSARRLS